VIFQSFEYISLLIAVILLYWWLPRLGQNLLLLGASYVFYAFVHPWLAIILAGYTTVNYIAALGVVRFPDHRRAFLVTAIVSSLFVLGVFKYLGFFVENITQLLATVGFWEDPLILKIFLPAGISFYTFQTLAYVIDVYYRRVEPRSNFVDLALYVSFFPQLVAGPIERAGRLLPQFERRRKADPTAMLAGVQLVVWGFFKKLVIADNVAIIVNKIFLLQEPSVPLLAVGVLAFAVQILADFSGYTDIARGSAQMLGINLTRNFDNPYLARSPADFWRRWHISLSFWFRDYVYIPLGGSRAGPRRNLINLMVTFLLTGLWHGAAWNFVLWGLYHGVLVAGHRLLSVRFSLNGRTGSLVAVFLTFMLVNVGWLIFRAGDLSIIGDSLSSQLAGDAQGGIRVTAFLFFQVILYSLPLWIHILYQQARVSPRMIGTILTPVRKHFRTAVAMILFTGIVVMRSQVSVDFIYFQF